MISFLLSIVSWNSRRTGNQRRLADGISPEATIDLTENDDVPESDSSNESVYNCPICLSKLQDPATTNCGHVFCFECLVECLVYRSSCPVCNSDVNNITRIYV
ncbi:hypothetical protein KR038_010447 [Drosophila bunnanda]|nr:hypothetical protein KR038_010447 [Drosophila bunnanda]